MARYVTILMIVFFSGGCTASDKLTPSCSTIELSDYYSNYIIFDVVSYGGGLTTESEANQWLGSEVVLNKSQFKIRDVVISNPTYKVLCYPQLEEGNVDTNRFSDFHGFAMDRKSIDVVEVYGKGDVPTEPYLKLEIVKGQVWDAHDGFMYMAK